MASYSAPKMTHTASRVTLASRTQVECQDAGLYSVQGAERIISMITERRVVHKLLLSHNNLGDDACTALFKFLGSAKGRQYPISEIHLGSNKIGNTGLLAIADYLKGNLHLGSLQLPNNDFTGDTLTIIAFVHAINTSRIETLNLASNRNLSDAFIETFLPILQCPTLRSLNLSATGLTSVSLPFIVKYLSSSLHCHLHSFSCNANQLGIPGVRAIIDAIMQYNYCLTEVGLYSNQGQVDNFDETLQESKHALGLLKLTVDRNIYAKRETQKQALRLLRYSRPLLLNHGLNHSSNMPQKLAPCDQTCSCIPDSKDVSSLSATRPQPDSPFLRLPSEIKQHILSFLSPLLSAAQRIRIYHYASLASTLPQLLPCLPSSTSHASGHSLCVPDPSSLGFGDRAKVWSIGGGGVGAGGGCASGKCLGSGNSVICHREQDRNAWLVAVGCDAYQPDEETR